VNGIGGLVRDSRGKLSAARPLLCVRAAATGPVHLRRSRPPPRRV